MSKSKEHRVKNALSISTTEWEGDGECKKGGKTDESLTHAAKLQAALKYSSHGRRKTKRHTQAHARTHTDVEIMHNIWEMLLFFR